MESCSSVTHLCSRAYLSIRVFQKQRRAGLVRICRRGKEGKSWGSAAGGRKGNRENLHWGEGREIVGVIQRLVLSEALHPLQVVHMTLGLQGAYDPRTPRSAILACNPRSRAALLILRALSSFWRSQATACIQHNPSDKAPLSWSHTRPHQTPQCHTGTRNSWISITPTLVRIKPRYPHRPAGCRCCCRQRMARNGPRGAAPCTTRHT